MDFPKIIQGGMGVGVSSWQLARAVSEKKQIGVVSGTAMDATMVRKLQLGDPGGHIRRALKAFPGVEISKRILDTYFKTQGKAPDEPYTNKPMVGVNPGRPTLELLVASGFTEVFLAKDGHNGWVGVNFLQKIQTPLLASLYGAMLAGVNIVLVGAGIPMELPRVIDGLCGAEAVDMKLQVHGAENGGAFKVTFDPKDVFDEPPRPLPRPKFFPIVSSVSLASIMIRKCPGGIDGLVIELPTAGGHNAPPRGKGPRSERGEPVYAEKDRVDLEAVRALGVPFWMAGSFGHPAKLRSALDAGAAGIQAGTLFALADESGLRDDLKDWIRQSCLTGEPDIFTDPVASPTGFPFKVLSKPESISDRSAYEQRHRVCDLGYLREAYVKPDGAIGWRCSAEPVDAYERKGGKPTDTEGRKCLCNGLMANIGFAQWRRDGSGEESPLITCGDDFSGVRDMLRNGASGYTAADAVDYLLG